MTLQSLRDRFLGEMGQRLPGWAFVASRRHFRRRLPGRNLAHVAFINHDDDFDVVLDVSIEFLAGRHVVCVLGASLGNIEGVGQTRYHVASESAAIEAAAQAVADFERVGHPFLDRFADPEAAVAVLRAGGREATLISPLVQLHAQQIAALEPLIE